jgi:uroporphyrinogen-III synthase
MTRPLDGVRVAIIENRYPEQLTQLLERQGAAVVSVPLLKEEPVEDAEGSRRFLSICENMPIDYIVFYTGVGVDILCKNAKKIEVLEKSRILARGPKAVNALKRAGIRVDLVADSATTEGILQTLYREPLKGKTVLVQLYGQDNPQLSTALQKKGATVVAVSIYSYAQASDSADIENLVKQIAEKKIHAIAFTSATQVPFLFESAAKYGDAAAFRACLKKDIVVVSVGEVTTRALRAAGVEPQVVPDEPKMGPMVKALANFFERRKG